MRRVSVICAASLPCALLGLGGKPTLMPYVDIEAGPPTALLASHIAILEGRDGTKRTDARGILIGPVMETSPSTVRSSLQYSVDSRVECNERQASRSRQPG